MYVDGELDAAESKVAEVRHAVARRQVAFCFEDKEPRRTIERTDPRDAWGGVGGHRRATKGRGPERG